MAHACVSAGLSLISISSVLSILALVLNYWEKTDGTNSLYIRFEIRRGLWQICIRTEHRNRFYADENVCFNNKPNTGTADGIILVFVRAFLVLAVTTLAGSVTCTVLKLFVWTNKHRLITVAWILAFTGGALMLCGFSAYMIIRQIFKDYMVAFYLAVISWSMSWIAGFFIFLASRTKD